MQFYKIWYHLIIDLMHQSGLNKSFHLLFLLIQSIRMEF